MDEIRKEFNHLLDILDRFDDRLQRLEEELSWIAAKVSIGYKRQGRRIIESSYQTPLRWDNSE